MIYSQSLSRLIDLNLQVRVEEDQEREEARQQDGLQAVAETAEWGEQ